VTFKVIGCVLFGHRWITETGETIPTTVASGTPGPHTGLARLLPGDGGQEATVGIGPPANDGTESVVICRWCGRREVLPPGTSIVEWRTWYKRQSGTPTL
jgi:hypothetical protein